jgi:hypothetical protein
LSNTVALVAALRTQAGVNNGVIRSGKIVQIDDQGRAIVDYAGNRHGPLMARSIMKSGVSKDAVGKEVLLVFDNDDLASPIIIGFIHAQLFDSAQTEAKLSAAKREVVIDGESMVFDAQREIVLRCGAACIILHADGRMVLRGTELTSRASRTNKIKGGTVCIN